MQVSDSSHLVIELDTTDLNKIAQHRVNATGLEFSVRMKKRSSIAR